MSLKSKKIFLLWCSPGFGMIDIWLPIIYRLRSRHDIKIDFVFPEPSSIRLENKDTDLFALASEMSDKVIYRGHSDRWFVSNTLIEAHSVSKFSKVDRVMADLSSRLIKGRLSNYLIFKLIGKSVKLLSKFSSYIKENMRHQVLYDIDLFKNVDAVLCDITKEHKLVNKELRCELNEVLKFSMLHGLFASWVTTDLLCSKSVKKRNNVTVYNMSKLESSGYGQCFGLKSENIIHSGIPRHDKSWVDFICTNKKLSNEKIFDSYVLIIGRPCSAYNTIQRKKTFLNDIYDIVCNKYNLKLVVKAHPKDDMEGIDGKIYNEALGADNYGHNWIFSDMHPFKLGKKSIFCITLFSGVALDMIALNKPVIECLSLIDLPLYDNENSLRDNRKNPVFQFRYSELVFGADNRIDLENSIKFIINNKEDATRLLRKKYEEYFEVFDKSSEFVANDIYKRISYLN